MAQKKHRRHHSAPKVPQQQIAHVDEASLKQEQEEITSLKRDYNKRMASANQFDELIHLPNGKRMFVDDGAIVGGINVYAQQHHKKQHGHLKHPSQHHKGHKKVHKKTHKKHAAKPHVSHKKHEASHTSAPESQPVPLEAPAHLAQHHKGAVKKSAKHHGHKKHHATAKAHHTKM